jgi:hypothetical protein
MRSDSLPARSSKTSRKRRVSKARTCGVSSFERSRRRRKLGGAAGFAPVAAEVVRVVDVALVEQDADLGAGLGHREEAASIAAAAHGAERERPGARRLD